MTWITFKDDGVIMRYTRKPEVTLVETHEPCDGIIEEMLRLIAKQSRSLPPSG